MKRRKVILGRQWFTQEIAESLGLGDVYTQIKRIAIRADVDDVVRVYVEMVGAADGE